MRQYKLFKRKLIMMDKIMEKINKLSLPAVILIASLILGGFFYASQVNKQRSIERQQEVKIEQEKRDQLAKEPKEQQAREEAEQALNTCLGNAGENYSNNWYRDCKARGALTSKCIELKELTYKEYLKKYGLTTDEEYKRQRGITDDNFFSGLLDYAKRQDECSCGLPLDLADRNNKSLQDDKDECFKKYPQK